MAKPSRVNRLFLDASYAIALASETDEHHSKAVELSVVIAEQGIPMVTTRAVLLEIGNGLARRHRRAAIRLLDSIESDEDIEVITPTEELYDQALDFVPKVSRQGLGTDGLYVFRGHARPWDLGGADSR